MFTHRIPLGHLAFLLEAGEFPPVVDDGEELPQEEQGEADSYDSSNHTQDDAQDVEDRRAFFRLLDADDELALVVVAVDKGDTAVVVVVEPTLPIRRILFCITIAKVRKAFFPFKYDVYNLPLATSTSTGTKEQLAHSALVNLPDSKTWH